LALTTLRYLRQEADRLNREADAIIQEAERERHPLLLGEAILTRAIIITARVGDQRFLLASNGIRGMEIPATAFNPMAQQLQLAYQIFERAGCLEGQVRSALVLADWYEINGRVDQARTLAESVLGPAQALEYGRHVSHAQEHITGDTSYRRMMSLLSEPRDTDAALAAASDADVARFAEDCLAAMELPKDRLPVVRRDWLAMRDIAREKMDWCRHIELHQDLRHTHSPATSYLTDPPRAVVCEKHGHRSRIESPDWHALLAAFKMCYCAGCPDRDPKQRPE
jgi:hypothetical protein